MTTIVLSTHAAREHARQALKKDLGDIDGKSSQEVRCQLLAELWLREEPAPSRGIREVLDYVIWGDSVEPRIAARLWRAAHDPAWKIRCLGSAFLANLSGTTSSHLEIIVHRRRSLRWVSETSRCEQHEVKKDLAAMSDARTLSARHSLGKGEMSAKWIAGLARTPTRSIPCKRQRREASLGAEPVE